MNATNSALDIHRSYIQSTMKSVIKSTIKSTQKYRSFLPETLSFVSFIMFPLSGSGKSSRYKKVLYTQEMNNDVLKFDMHKPQRFCEYSIDNTKHTELSI